MTFVAEGDSRAHLQPPVELFVQSSPEFTADATVAIVGLGYVGLPTAISLTLARHAVIGIDVSEARLRAIAHGAVDLPPDEVRQLAAEVAQGRLELTTEARRLASADVVIICVPTPLDSHFLPELDTLKAACAEVVRWARRGQLIVLTSTTYAGSTRELLIEPLLARGVEVGVDINVAFSPERINPGDQMYALASVPRVVGGATAWCAERAERFLKRIADSVHIVSTTNAAELTKLFENTFRAVNISLVNEFADVCTELGADVIEVLDAAATKPYGFMRFAPGPGVGGHCIPCDPHYLVWQLRRHRLRMPIVESAMQAIERRPVQVVERICGILAHLSVAPSQARVLVVGVAYKPNIADVRESPAIEIISRLVSLGAKVTATDPHVAQVGLGNGKVLPCMSLADVDVIDFDLVVLHTLHRVDDLSVLSHARQLLDATYQFDAMPQRLVL